MKYSKVGISLIEFPWKVVAMKIDEKQDQIGFPIKHLFHELGEKPKFDITIASTQRGNFIENSFWNIKS